MKKFLLYLLPLTLALTIVGTFTFALTAHMAHAIAQVAATNVPPPGSVQVATSTTTTLTATVTPDPSLLDLLTPVYNAFAGGHYAYMAALMVVVLVALTKHYLAPRIPFLESNAGGSLLALFAAFGTALASALAAPTAVVSWSLVESAALIGFGAAGGYAVVKNVIIEPFIRPWSLKAPAWSQPFFTAVLWAFSKFETDGERAPTQPGFINAKMMMGLAMLGLAVFESTNAGCSLFVNGGTAVVDCTIADGAKIGALVSDMEKKIANGTGTWSAIEAEAVAAGKTIGGCALAKVVQDYTTAPATQATQGVVTAHEALEDFRKSQAGGATFHTAHGDL